MSTQKFVIDKDHNYCKSGIPRGTGIIFELLEDVEADDTLTLRIGDSTDFDKNGFVSKCKENCLVEFQTENVQKAIEFLSMGFRGGQENFFTDHEEVKDSGISHCGLLGVKNQATYQAKLDLIIGHFKTTLESGCLEEPSKTKHKLQEQ